jgi:hypothetical protein
MAVPLRSKPPEITIANTREAVIQQHNRLLQTVPKAYTVSSGYKGGTNALAVVRTRELLC